MRGRRFSIFLVEHKMREERGIWSQLLGYLSALLESHPNEPVLPMVVPVIFSHAPRPWKGPRSLRERYGEIPPEVAPFLLNFAPVIVDLAAMVEGEVQRAGMSVVGLAFFHLLRTAWEKDKEAVLTRLLPLWKKVPDLTTLSGMIEYFLGLVSEGDATSVRFIERIEEALDPEREGVMGSLLEMIQREGHEKGLQEGWLEGWKEGRQEGVEASMRKLLSRGTFSHEEIADLLDVDLARVRTIAREGAH